jgi:hypothetical protein
MALMRLFTCVLALLSATPAAGASELQVAVIYDTSLWHEPSDPALFRYRGWYLPNRRGAVPARMISVIESFDAALWKTHGAVELRAIACGEDVAPRSAVERELRLNRGELASLISAEVTSRIAQDKECETDVDLVDRVVEELPWKDRASKHIIVIGHLELQDTRVAAEELMHRAERLGIVVHVLHVFPIHGYVRDFALVGDVADFLEHPTRPLGRVPRFPRHATSINGGSYRAIATSRSKPAGRFDPTWWHNYELEEAAKLLTRAQSKPGVLEDLASGKRRPSEVSKDELPEVLREVDLEPLLDVIWDYVDARRALGEALLELDPRHGPAKPADLIGRELADDVMNGRRLKPSRR